MLLCLNLLEKPDSGAIIINNQDILNPNMKLINLSIQVGMVFQSYNLFTYKNILENCCLAPMKILKMPFEKAKKMLYFI